MLVLSRKEDQKIIVGDVTLTVVKISGNNVKIGVDAPTHVPILRGELAARIAAAQQPVQEEEPPCS